MSLVPPIGKPGIRFENQAKFHPLRYLSGLAKVVRDDGGLIFEHTAATEFSEHPRCVKANGRWIDASYIVIATHVPLVGEAGLIGATLLQTKLAPYSSYVVGAEIPKDTLPEALFWDTADPYDYLRIDHGAAADYAVFGGQDRKTGQDKNPLERYYQLEKRLKQLIPREFARLTIKRHGE